MNNKGHQIKVLLTVFNSPNKEGMLCCRVGRQVTHTPPNYTVDVCITASEREHTSEVPHSVIAGHTLSCVRSAQPRPTPLVGVPEYTWRHCLVWLAFKGAGLPEI